MAWLKIRKFVHFYLLAFVSAIFLLGLTLFIFQETQERIAERNLKLFDLRAEAAKTAIEKRMKDYIQILKGAQGLFKVSDSVSLHEWKAYVQTLNVDENYPGIQGIGYASFFPFAQLSSLESKMKSLGFPEFRVWPEGKKAFYSSIIYLEPFDKMNLRAFGYDMFTDSVRREAMEAARDTGKPALSGMVTLVQEAQETTSKMQKGFLLYLPIYQEGIEPHSVIQRRTTLKGFVYSPFRINDLMQGILGKRFTDLDIEIYDGPRIAGTTLLFDKDAVHAYEQASLQDLHKFTSVVLGGHTWQVYFAAIPGQGYEAAFPYFILGGGFLISTLIFIIMFSLANVERSNYLKQVITDNSTAALFIVDTNDYCTFMNPAAVALTGYTLQEIRENTLHNMVHHSYPDGSPYPASDCPIIKVLYERGVLYNHESMFIRKNGERIHVSINAQPIQENASIVAHILEVRDITQRKNSEITLREKNKNLQTLNNIGKNLAAELELNKLLQIVTDSCTELTGADFGAFFYNQINEKGENLMIYNVSGVDPKFFADFPMPRNTKIFSPTFHGEGIIRSDDITKDPRYGKNKPYQGMPKGHLPVKSYLAVPVVSRSGEVIGGLIFGHSVAGVFDENAEEIVKGIAAQAAIAVDNSRLFEAINAKNEQLLKINNDLDNFVYTASHDLKAPVLNIEGLVTTLATSLKGNETEKTRKIIDMIQISVSKFKETIQALTEISKTNRNLDEEIELINLNELLDDVKLSIRDIIEESGAHIQTKLECPEIKLSKVNLKSIFLNLITNAIKYRSPTRPLMIHICCRKDFDRTILSVSDNGLGVPSHFLPKIFMMFKRYHTHTEGSGVGLYLVKRIVENYGGSIELQSEVGQGTTFIITLPEF